MLEFVTLITLIASFLPRHASLILKISFYITGKSHCYSLGMVKIEAFDDSNFMHQTVSVCHTDHPDSIVSSMACIGGLKKNFLYNWKSYSLGMVKIEASDDSYFMHQTVSVCHTDHPDSIVSSMACIVGLKKNFLYNWKITLLWPWYGENRSV